MLRRWAHTLVGRLVAHPRTLSAASGPSAGPTLLATDAAVETLHELQKKHAGKHMALAVDPGGCHGFTYRFALVNGNPEGFVFVPGPDAMAVAVDTCSMEMLAGATLDYVSEPIGSSFRVRFDSTRHSCGCGVSFGPSQ